MKRDATSCGLPAKVGLAACAAILAAVALAGCTAAQPQYALTDVMVYITQPDENGTVIVVPFFNITHSGPDAANLTLDVSLYGGGYLAMNGYEILPNFTNGRYQPPLNLGMYAQDGQNATLRLRLTSDAAMLLDAEYVLQLGAWPKETWLLLSPAS